jgi:hypothetical protein
MARDPIPSESEALTRCGDLLRYAAENVKDVPKPIVSTICAAWDAEENKEWNQQIATEFWVAFNSLSTLIRPVNMDTLSTNLRQIPLPRWKFWRKPGFTSLSGRTAARYVLWLNLFLIVAVVLGFLVSSANRLSAEIEKHIKNGDESVERIVAETDMLEPTLGDKKFSDTGADKQKEIAILQNQLQVLGYIDDQLLQKDEVLLRLLRFGRRPTEPYNLGTLARFNNIEEVRDAITNYYKVRRYVAQDLLKGSIYSGVITSSVLPIILGIMGACAYVVRFISDQIKQSAFSSTSPIRHRVRIALGALAGVVIGFGGVVNAGSLSSSALAFIAGYAVEPVFATFDSIAEKFRR